MTFSLTQSEKAYLSESMNKVSRSFALVSPQVESPLDDFLATAYLICRVVDNIEDCFIPYSQKCDRFFQLSNLLEVPTKAEAVLTEWETVDWQGLTTDEAEMMTTVNGLTLWQIYAKIPPIFRTSIKVWTREMVFGMKLAADLENEIMFTTKERIRLPKTAVDYDRYCYYVAGTVGRMITELAITYYGINNGQEKLLFRYSETCGRALQKTNIVKDFAKDLARGDCFLPDEWLREVDYQPLTLNDVPGWWKKQVLLDVLHELDEAVNYVLHLPKTAVGYRKAGLLMMLPAYKTLLLAAERCASLFTPNHMVKISRAAMGKCLIQAQMMVTNDGAILDYAHNHSFQIRRTLE